MAVIDAFEDFIAARPAYAELYRKLEAESRKLAMAAAVVPTVHGPDLARIADPILKYVQHRYGEKADAMYASRCRRLEELQMRFDRDPRTETLGCPEDPVSRDSYNLALLLSIVLTNHRFEIMQSLERFLSELGGQGTLAGLGTGTGYEIKLAAGLLPEWVIESYDIEPTAEEEARRLLAYFGITRPIRFGREFPIDAPDPARFRRYDAIVACEVLEHLPDPARSLRVMREYLAENGRMFVTMAVNIAQEDHIFLYPGIGACRDQLRDCGLRVISECITPQVTLPPPPDRERAFRRGNYVAVAGVL